MIFGVSKVSIFITYRHLFKHPSNLAWIWKQSFSLKSAYSYLAEIRIWMTFLIIHRQLDALLQVWECGLAWSGSGLCPIANVCGSITSMNFLNSCAPTDSSHNAPYHIVIIHMHVSWLQCTWDVKLLPRGMHA